MLHDLDHWNNPQSPIADMQFGRQDDHWNAIASGFLTGGVLQNLCKLDTDTDSAQRNLFQVLAARGGWKAASRNAVIGWPKHVYLVYLHCFPSFLLICKTYCLPFFFYHFACFSLQTAKGQAKRFGAMDCMEYVESTNFVISEGSESLFCARWCAPCDH